MAIGHLRALAEQSVSLVEHEDGASCLRLVEDASEILLGLADVLTDDRGEVDAVELDAEVVSEDLGRPRSAAPLFANEECCHSAPLATLPFWKASRALLYEARDLAQ